MNKKYNAKEIFQNEMLESVLSSLDQEKIPWEKPWDNFLGLPMNAVTGKPYNGSNSYNLMFSGLSQGFTDPRWCTFKQAKEKGWSVKKGSKSTKVFYVSLIDRRTNKPVTSKNYSGLTKEESELLKENTIPVFKNYSVFNAEQINDIPELDKNLLIKNTFNDDKTERYLADLIKGMNLVVKHKGDEAFYTPTYDYVQLPPKESFKTYQGYVETYLHEVTHATGYKTRLDRNLNSSFGTGAYAKEELVADITSMMLAIDLGIITGERQIKNTKAYCQSWHKQLKNNPKILPEVIESMNKARNYMHEKGNWIFEEIEPPLEVNIDTLSASVKIENYANQVLGFNIEPHSRNLKRLVEHDSCIIYPDSNSYFRYSSQRGGNIYEFIMEFENVNFKQALENVKNYYNDFKPKLIEKNTVVSSSNTDRNLELPRSSDSIKQGFEYLTHQRGISEELVKDMFDKNYIFQDDKNNVVFLGYENNIPAYASRRSTYSNFKGDVAGSRKEVGFFINNHSDTLVISESPIDSLSILDMQENKTNHLGTGGVGACVSCFKYFVENNPTARETNNIIISFDNDEAGINASETLSEYIKNYYPSYNIDIQYPKNKDFNLDLINKKKNQEKTNMDKYTLHSIEPFDSNFHENYYRIKNNENNSIYVVRLPKNLDTIDNIYAYKIDTADKEVKLDRGKRASHEELKEIADFLNNNNELNINLPQHLLNRLEVNLNDKEDFYLDSVEKIKSTNNENDYDFIKYNVRRGSNEYNIKIDNLDNSVSGDVIKYGGWHDITATEKKEILDFLIKYELNIEPISIESKLMVNKELLKENNPNQLFTEVPEEKTIAEPLENKPIPNIIEFGYTNSDSSFEELQAYLVTNSESIDFKANGVSYSSKDFEYYEINDDTINKILNNIEDEETVDLLHSIVEDLVNDFENLATLEIDKIAVVHQNQNNVWFEQGVYDLSDKDIENKYVDLMLENPDTYSFTSPELSEHFEKLKVELTEDIKKQDEEIEFNKNFIIPTTELREELIRLIKQYKLEDETNWNDMLQVYLDEQVDWKDINEFTTDFFRDLGVDLPSPITSLSFNEDRQTMNIEINDNITEEDYENIINFNLETGTTLAKSDTGVSITKDDEIIHADSMKQLYEEQGFKDLLLNDFKILGLTELQHSSLFKNNPDLMKKLIESDNSYTKAFIEATKEKDLDNDGVPDRIDIDDNRNEIQSISDMSDEPKKQRGVSR
ncbi:zincin-like metallopeptidase domain-containing protein [Erysipelothrix rhusiopathiae]|nr:zincin-like metallopeptidase domain-containing protein [Erysipelothrix rhusiopathiae]